MGPWTRLLGRSRRPANRATVEIYTWRTCPFCIRARWLLRRRGVDFVEYRVGRDTPDRRRMIERAEGRSTVPQVFINGRGIGGCSELLALDRSGELASMIAVPPPDGAGAAARAG